MRGIFASQWKRPLIPVVLALMGGLTAGAWGLKLPGAWLIGGLAVAWLLMFSLYLAQFRLRLLPLLFFALLGVGLYHQALSPRFPPNHVVGLSQKEELVISGRLARPSRVTPEGVRLFVEAQALKSFKGWKPLKGLILVQAPPFTPPPVGTRLVVRGKLREFRDLKNPGAPNRVRQWAAEGIFRQLHLKDSGHLVILASPEGISLAERLRGGIRRLLAERPPQTRAIYLSMLLGDQGEVTPEMRENLARTGTSHLLVINGMHLGAVAAVTYFAVFWLLRRFSWLLLRVNVLKLATLAAVLPVVAYAHLAGGSPSTERAEIMVLAYLLLMFLGRPREIWSALALAALVILILSPLRLFSVSFQLSFAAVAGILYLVPRWLPDKVTATSLDPDHPRKARLWRWTLEALAVSGAASLATAPLVARHFQVISLYGFLVNLAAIPLVLMAALPLGELAVLSEALSLTPLAQIFLYLGELPLKLGYALICWVARLPGSGLIIPTPTWPQIILIYALILLLFPGRRRWWTWAGAALTGLALALTVAIPLVRPLPGCEITILDNPAGLSGVVVAPQGERLVLSAAWPVPPGGTTGSVGALPAYLHWRQFRRVEAVLALELNLRNALELLTLVKQFRVGGLWWQGPRPTGVAVTLMNFLGDSGHPARDLSRGNPPETLGKVGLEYLEFGRDQGRALLVKNEGRQVLILPPLRRGPGEGGEIPVPGALEALIVPESLPPELLTRLPARNLIVYGFRDTVNRPAAGTLPVYYAREGLVTLTLTQDGATVTQWQP